MAMKVIDHEQGTLEWHEWRKGGISASEAAVIMDIHVADPDNSDLPLNPYMTIYGLWLIKCGFAEPDDLSKNPCVQRGNRLEDQARQFFEELYGGDLLLPLTAESALTSCIRASFDGVDEKIIPHEIKVVMPSSFEQVLEKGVESEAYKLYYPQVQVQIYVSGAKRARLCFWEPEEDVEHLDTNYRVFEIERDEDFIIDFLAKADKFMEHVNTQKPPAMDKNRDVFVPNEDDAAEWAVIAKHAQNLLKEREALAEKVQDNKDRLEKAGTHLRGFMDDFKKGRFAGVQIVRQDRRGSIDYKKIVEERLPNLKPEELENYRRIGSTSWRLTPKDDPTVLSDDNMTKAPLPSDPFAELHTPDTGLGLTF